MRYCMAQSVPGCQSMVSVQKFRSGRSHDEHGVRACSRSSVINQASCKSSLEANRGAG